VLALLVAALVLCAPPSAGATGQYGDSSGDSGSAPDIDKVTVTSDASGTIQFDIAFTGRSPTDDAQTVLLLDTDVDAATGAVDLGGADYVFLDDKAAGVYDFARWDGSGWDSGIPYSTVHVFSTATRIRIVVNRSELGNTQGFNFLAASRATHSADERDMAPDEGMWNYSLGAGGPDIREVVVDRKPAAPRAGQTFTVAATGLQLPATATVAESLPRPESYDCRATVAGKAIRGSGDGGCTWKLPKTSRGRALVVTVTVRYQGVTKSVAFTYRVR
jgi:hypothetical protein